MSQESNPHPPKSTNYEENLAFTREFARLQEDFAIKRNAVFELLHKIEPADPAETTEELYLRVARNADSHWWTNDFVDAPVNLARRAGRAVMFHVFNSPDMLARCEHSFLIGNYGALAGVYAFTAPLDAVNWKHMKKWPSNFPVVSSWATVMAVNEKAEDIHCKFLTQHASVMERVKKGELLKDPFPSRMMASILLSGRQDQLPVFPKDDN